MRTRIPEEIVAPLRRPAVVVSVLNLASAVAAALSARFGGEAVDALVRGTDAVGPAVAALIAGLTGSLIWSASDVVTIRAATGMASALRRRLVDHALSLPAGFFTERSVGEVTDRISTDVDTLATGVVGQVKPIAMGLTGGVVAWVFTVTVNPWVSVLLVPATGLIVWGARPSSRRVADTSRQLQAEWATVAGTLEESFAARADLRQALGRGLVMRRFAEHGARLWTAQRAVARARARLALAGVGGLRALQVLVVALGAVLAVRGTLSAGSVFASLGLVQLFTGRLDEVLGSFTRLADAIASAGRVRELLAETPEPSVTVPLTGTPDRTLAGPALAGAARAGPATVDWTVAPDLRFVDLRFSYPDDDRLVLHGVDVTVGAGRASAIVGPTGSGKSTLARLVNRSVDVPAGSVFIGGVDVCSIPLAELRRHVGVLTQRVELLRASLFDNVTLFDPDIGEERVGAALRELGLGGWVDSLPDGLHTVVGATALPLSSGEEQLVAFARLLVRNPAVIVMDEATARLDPATEMLVRSALDRLVRGRTVLIIAHRLASITHVDDVVVLERGRVVEAGRREDLLARPDSVFAGLVAAAREGEAVGSAGRAATGEGAARRRGPAPDPAEQPQPTVARPRFSPFGVAWSLLRRHPRFLIPAAAGWVITTTAPAVSTWAWRDLLGRLEPGGEVRGPLGVMAVATAVGIGALVLGHLMIGPWWVRSLLCVRANLVAAQLHPSESGTARRGVSAGDATSRLWDAEDLARYADHFIDIVGAVAFVAAVAALGGSPWILGWMVLPMAIPGAVAVACRSRVDRVAIDHARIKGRWTARMAEVCAAGATIKAFGAESGVAAHIDELTAERSRLAQTQRAQQIWLFGTVFRVSILAQYGILVVAALGARGGSALLGAGAAASISQAAGMMAFPGLMVTLVTMETPAVRAKLARMERLLPVGGKVDLTLPPPDFTLPPAQPRPVPTASPVRERLERLSLRGVTVDFDDGVGALHGIDLDVDRGQILVVTGSVGSGKSTLLEVLAGLRPISGGELLWNGRPIRDPSVVLRPPNSAWVAQVPRLVSGTVAENVALDRDVDVLAAIDDAELAPDVRSWGGSDTLIGHRGLRLSGGQSQRLATARALATDSELLVVDDLSSALDVMTEQRVWERLRASGRTVVAVSHKGVAFAAADRVVTLDAGRVVLDGGQVTDGERRRVASQ